MKTTDEWAREATQPARCELLPPDEETLRRHLAAAHKIISLDVAPQRPTAEATLWGAVLWRAILDARGIALTAKPAQRRQLKHKALAWFSSRRTGVGSFMWACENLGMDPGAVRRQAQALASAEPRAGNPLATRDKAESNGRKPSLNR